MAHGIMGTYQDLRRPAPLTGPYGALRSVFKTHYAYETNAGPLGEKYASRGFQDSVGSLRDCRLA